MKLVRLTYGSTIPAMSYFSSDLLWASGMKLADPFFLLEFQNGRRVVFVNGAEYPKVKKTSKEIDDKWDLRQRQKPRRRRNENIQRLRGLSVRVLHRVIHPTERPR